MKIWNVEEGFILDEEAPEWATKAAWRIFKGTAGDLLVRAWVDEENTKYQYMRGYSGFNSPYDVIQKDFFSPQWANRAKVFATLEEMEPMVCHDQYGFSTPEFRKYSQRHWDAISKMANEITRQAIRDGVNPIAIKELMLSAIDCGVTLAKTQAYSDDYAKREGE